LRKQGADLDVLVNDAYDEVGRLASRDKNPVNVDQVIKDIDMEIARIKGSAPSPSDAEKAAIKILENEKSELARNPANAEQLVQQIKNYNRNVSGIYKKAEFSGLEDEVRGAYAFLNNSIRNTIESQSGSDVRGAMKAADSLFMEQSKLNRVENLISKAFKNGEYSPKKLTQLLNSSQGNIVRREMGDKFVTEIQDIARYGEEAVYTKVKEITLIGSGELTISFDLATDNGGSGDSSAGRIYRNGVAIGTERNTNNTSFVTYTEEISGWSNGDKIQIYCKTNDIRYKIKNFIIYGTTLQVNTD